MKSLPPRTVISALAMLVLGFGASSTGAAEIEIDQGVFTTVPEQFWFDSGQSSSHLTGLEIGIDVTHDSGRQGFVTSSYVTLQGDLVEHGASLTFVTTGPLTLSVLEQFDAWWIEEDFILTFSPQELADVLQYVEEGGCVFLNGDENDPALLAQFGMPYANSFGFGGFSSDITPSFLTDALPVSKFPGAVTQVLIPGPVNVLAPVPPALDVVRDGAGNPMVAFSEIGSGAVVVFSDEIAIDSTIASADNRTLSNRVFELCALGLNAPPVCENAAAVPDYIWSPNHEFVEVAVTGVTDPDGDPIAIVVDSIHQDEEVWTGGGGAGRTAPDATGVGTDTASVRAERNGNPNPPGDGRVYHIAFTAEDGQGGSCSDSVTVCVPHDQGQGSDCIDGGPLFDSTVGPACGIGFELALLLPGLVWLHRRRRRGAA